MVTHLRKLTNSIEKFSPSSMCVPGDYVGIQVGSRDSVVQERTKIRKCAITRCVTPQVIIKASRDGADAIIAYQGLLSHPVRAVTDGLLDKIRLLIENKINLYVVHTSWLSAECGVNDTFAEILGLIVTQAFNIDIKGRTVPLGRVCTFGKRGEQNILGNDPTVSLSDFLGMISHQLSTDDVKYVGNSLGLVKKILLLTGEYGEISILKMAKSMGVDTFVTSNIHSEVATLSNELGINYVCVIRDPIESLGMRRLMQLLSIDIPEVEFIFIESGLLWKKYEFK